MRFYQNFLNRLKALFSKKRKAYDANNLQGYLTDTNVLLNNPEVLEHYKVFIPSHVLREVEHLELTRKQDRTLQFQIRRFKKLADNLVEDYIDLEDYKFDLRKDWDKNYVDNILVQIALDKNLAMITNDRLLRKKCKLYGIVVIKLEDSNYVDDGYKGYIEVEMPIEEFTRFHDTRLDKNEFNLLLNQYLIILDPKTKKPYRALKYDGNYYISIKEKNFDSVRVGKFIAKDLYQACVLDSLMSNKLTLIRGKAGTAKTLSAITYAMQQIEKGKHNKLIVFSNSLPTKGAVYLGMNKGSLKDKLMQVSVGHILASKIGSYDEVEAMMATEELLVLPMSDIRGFDTTGMKAIILITEAQNLDRELMKLAIQRVGEDCKMIIEGDNLTQLDSELFEGDNNGMNAVSSVFRGHDYYGEVELKNIYRSELARMAEKLTDIFK
jgi:PhoH-like ATPase